MPGRCTLYAPVDANGRFRFAQLSQKKKGIQLTESEKKYERLTVKAVLLTLSQDADPLPVDGDDDWAAKHTGWIIQNPDDSLWMDTLAPSEAETRAWWGDAERAAKREALGFKVVRVQLEVAA
ncbi:hypothetical protein [Azonexus hydrophilus]|uniref:Uncharacterized protein n=1 Tax=Azonexus hydrophilus TaxID=418702 RepID=A0ABZ2XPH1_9RHOO